MVTVANNRLQQIAYAGYLLQKNGIPPNTCVLKGRDPLSVSTEGESSIIAILCHLHTGLGMVGTFPEGWPSYVLVQEIQSFKHEGRVYTPNVTDIMFTVRSHDNEGNGEVHLGVMGRAFYIASQHWMVAIALFRNVVYNKYDLLEMPYPFEFSTATLFVQPLENLCLTPVRKMVITSTDGTKKYWIIPRS